LLLAHPRPTRDQIKEGMEPQLCRCAAHQRILAAIEDVAGQGGGGHD
jgi:aerobic-type carbon monoxide dehydrogenase small subunit (CoxS/CutS family)